MTRMFTEKRLWDNIWKPKERTVEINDQWELYDRIKLNFLLREIKIFKSPKTLECGCGSAKMSVWLALRGYETYCIDFSHEAVRVASNNYEFYGLKGIFIVEDIEHLPFKDDIFDVVMSYGTIEHFEDSLSPVNEMVRTLKPDGLLFGDIPNGSSFVCCFEAKLSNLKKRLKKKEARYERLITFKELAKILERSGLNEIRIFGSRLFPIVPAGSLDRIFTPLFKSVVWIDLLFEGSVLAKYIGMNIIMRGQKIVSHNESGRCLQRLS